MSIPTSNIFHPSAISLPAANYQLISDLQLLMPHVYKEFVEKYGDQSYIQFLSTYAGMEKVEGRAFTHWEDRGKLMIAITNKTAVTAPAAGATVTVTIIVGDHWNAGTQSPIRVGENLRIASSGIEGKILTINTATPNAHTLTVRPLRSDQAFASAGSADLAANEVLQMSGNTEAGEASSNINPQVPIDAAITNTTTEIREDWTATDRAEMEQIWFNFSGDDAPVARDGQSAFTYKGLVRANQRFLNNVDLKLMKGDIQNNTGLNAGTVGTLGLLPAIVAGGEAATYTIGSLDIAKINEVTRLMDVNGGTMQYQWLMDIYQRQEFNDELFALYPAGAFVWGNGSASEDASVSYGFQNFRIDGYMLQVKKYTPFNTEVVYGKTPADDQYRDFGILIPQGKVRDRKTAIKLPNLTVMYQEPRGGGSIANGIKVWQYGGASPAANSATMIDTVSMITYKGLRVAAANQFLTVSGS